MFRHVFLTFLLSIILNVITIFIGIVSNVSSMMCHTAFSPLSKFYLILYVFNLVTANICVEFGMECLVLYLPILKQFPTKFLLLIDPQLFLFQRIMRGLSTRNFLIYIYLPNPYPKSSQIMYHFPTNKYCGLQCVRE